MTQWIVFDEAAVKPLAARTHQKVEVAAGDLLEIALSGDRPTLVVGLAADGVQVVTITRHDRQTEQAPPQFVAGGFLGLTDEIADEEPPRPGNWWQKIWE